MGIYVYDLTFNQEEAHNKDVWDKVWQFNPWPKIASFIWLVVHKQILIGENLMRRGMNGPFWCTLGEGEEETMNHLLDSSSIASSLWELVAEIFHRTNWVRGIPHHTIKSWDKEVFKNLVIHKI